MAGERVQRRLAAILAADVVGFSSMMEADEAGTLDRLKAIRREVIDPAIDRYDGRMVKLMGDGALVEFASAVDAVTCALDIQRAVYERGDQGPGATPIRFRVGINIGDIIVDGEDIYGDGVNVAARLEGLTPPGEVYISRAAADQVRDKAPIRLESRGEHALKNIARPVEVFQATDADRPPPPNKRSQPAPQAPLGRNKPSVAILAFNNMSRDPEQEYFSDGISEDIITDLSKVPGLHVIARNSSFIYKGSPVLIPRVAAELGVRYVLEGSVRKAGSRVRVTAQLIDAEAGGGHVWADRYDRDLTDIFAVQDELTQEIVGALRISLTRDETRGFMREQTDNLDAYDSFLRGREEWWKHTKGGNARAQDLLQRAIDLDPNYAPAHAFLALAHMLDYIDKRSAVPEESLVRAVELANKAVELDPAYPNAHHALASVLMWTRQHDDALSSAKRAITLDANFADAQFLLGLLLHYAGRSEEAIDHFDRGMASDPYHQDIYFHWRAQACFQLGRYEDAARLLQQRLIRNPETDISHVLLAACYGHLSRIDEARREWDEVFRINPDYSLEHRRKVLPYKNPADFDRIVDGLRRAGVVD